MHCRAVARVQGPRRGSSDPSGYVMEDLLAHAVDNMRIKNVSKTQLARRAEQPKPSLLVSTECRSVALRKRSTTSIGAPKDAHLVACLQAWVRKFCAESVAFTVLPRLTVHLWLCRNKRWEPASVQQRFEASREALDAPARVWCQQERKG